MNRSLVISRYATALLKYTTETGEGERVCREAETLMKTFRASPDFSKAIISQDVISADEKLKLVSAALDGKPSDGIIRFCRLLARNSRMDLMQDILRNFITKYFKSVGKRKVFVKVAAGVDDDTMQRFAKLVKDKTGEQPIFEIETDPSLIGGFVLDLDDSILDASVKRQLELIKEQFIERNRRIV